MPPTTSKPRYALYTRISKDPTGQSTAPARQEKECRALAKERGFQIVEVFTDTDLSAYRKGVVRPQYEAMLEAMADGAFDGVVVWKLDRLVRRIVEFSRFWAVASKHDVALVSKSDSYLDTTTGIGLGIVYMIVGLAQQESDNTSTRLKAKEREQAQAGIAKRGGKKAYGINEDWTKVVKAEAAVLKDAAERIINGETLNSIVTDLNARGVKSATGRRWNRRSLQNVLRQARLFGWREMHGELVAKGTWPAILDEATGRKLRELIPPTNRAPAGEAQPREARKYLLSGLLECSCGKRLKGSTSNNSRWLRYTCPSSSAGGCGGTSVDRAQADAEIVDMVLDRLNSPNVTAMLRSRKKGNRDGRDATLLAELAALGERSAELAVEFASGGLPAKAYTAATQEIEKTSRRLNNELAMIRQTAPLANALSQKNLASTWETMEVGRQRAVIDALLEKVVVHNVGSPWYDERMRVTLLAEADDFDAQFEAMRSEAEAAKASGDQKHAAKLIHDSWQTKKKADRRRASAENPAGPGNGGVFRVERLQPIWRV